MRMTRRSGRYTTRTREGASAGVVHPSDALPEGVTPQRLSPGKQRPKTGTCREATRCWFRAPSSISNHHQRQRWWRSRRSPRRSSAAPPLQGRFPDGGPGDSGGGAADQYEARGRGEGRLERCQGRANVKITYERSGGVAGVAKRTVVDTDALDPAERGEWEALVNDASFSPCPTPCRPRIPKRATRSSTLWVSSRVGRRTR